MRTVTVRDRGEATVIVLAGEIDLQTSPEVRTAVLDVLGRGRPVVVDLSAISYIDSSGVASLVEGFQVAKKRGLSFVLAQASPSVMRVLRLARLDRIFAFADDVDAALEKSGA